MADDTESLHDPNWFEFAGPVFVVGPFPRPADQERLLRTLVRVESAGADGVPGLCVAVFTDLDLAERFVAGLGERGAAQKPLTFASLDDFAAALTGLLMLGETHVGIDPGSGNVRRIDIPRMLDGIRNRKRKP